MRTLSILGAVLVLGMTAATIWVITGAPGAVDEVPAALPPTPPVSSPTPVIISVEENQAVRDIGQMLEDEGVIDSAIQFRVLTELLGFEQMLRAGEYEFDPGTPALQVVYRMRRGIISPLFVTVIEGWRLEEVADALDEQGVISREDFLEAAVAGNFDDVEDFDFLQRLGPATPLEGYLFPATYFYRRSDKAEDVIQRMLEAMDENFSGELRRDALNVGLTMHGVLTLASIIEREARVPDERPKMAQVFLTRLRRGIPLEADPTVQYAIAQDAESVAESGYWKRELTAEDLEVSSPYNTYRFAGLPLGPIAAPRLDSIEAVIEPADTNYLYIVATGDEDGSHIFAETLEEHLENVRKYRGGADESAP